MQNNGVVDRTSETARRGSQKNTWNWYTVNHGLSALTFINKRYFILLEIIATVTGLFSLLLKI